MEQAHQEHGAQHDPLIKRSKKLADAAREQEAAIGEMDRHQAPVITQLR
jgi:hypothetical protein